MIAFLHRLRGATPPSARVLRQRLSCRSALLGALLVAVGCERSTESRLRELFAIPAATAIDTTTVRTAILRDIHIGSARDSLLHLLDARGVGVIAHTSLAWVEQDTVLVVWIARDPNRMQLVQAEYRVLFAFGRSGALRDVRVTEMFTGP